MDGIDAIIRAIRYTDEIVDLAADIDAEIFSNIMAIISKIGPASPTYNNKKKKLLITIHGYNPPFGCTLQGYIASDI